MQVKSHEGVWTEGIGMVDDHVSDHEDLCPANVGPTDNEYVPCLKKMRRYRSGTTVCMDHGDMH